MRTFRRVHHVAHSIVIPNDFARYRYSGWNWTGWTARNCPFWWWTPGRSGARQGRTWAVRAADTSRYSIRTRAFGTGSRWSVQGGANRTRPTTTTMTSSRRNAWPSPSYSRRCSWLRRARIISTRLRWGTWGIRLLTSSPAWRYVTIAMFHCGIFANKLCAPV